MREKGHLLFPEIQIIILLITESEHFHAPHIARQMFSVASDTTYQASSDQAVLSILIHRYKGNTSIKEGVRM